MPAIFAVYCSWSLYILSIAFGLDYYTEVLDLEYLLEHMSSDPFYSRYLKLNRAIAELITDYSLVSFIPLDIQVCLLYHTGITCY